jgi:hypothetical protein
MWRSLVLLFIVLPFSLRADDLSPLVGVATSVGYSFSKETTERYIADLHCHLFMFNFATELSYEDDIADNPWSSRAYFGLGGVFVDIQRGFGLEGPSWRLRSILWPSGFTKYDRWKGLFYPPKPQDGSQLRGIVISLTVDYFHEYKRYGVMVGTAL